MFGKEPSKDCVYMLTQTGQAAEPPGNQHPGEHASETWSKTQSTHASESLLALSAGEREFYAALKTLLGDSG